MALRFTSQGCRSTKANVKAVVQRVNNAAVTVNGEVKGSIDKGLLVYLGVAHDDSQSDADWLAEKISNLRIFNDQDGKMNWSINQIEPGVNDKKIGMLAISQFTLLGDARKGRRPSWEKAAPPEKANELYQYFILQIKERGMLCESGEFQAHMMVAYTNDGPVTILLDTKEK